MSGSWSTLDTSQPASHNPPSAPHALLQYNDNVVVVAVVVVAVFQRDKRKTCVANGVWSRARAGLDVVTAGGFGDLWGGVDVDGGAGKGVTGVFWDNTRFRGWLFL